MAITVHERGVAPSLASYVVADLRPASVTVDALAPRTEVARPAVASRFEASIILPAFNEAEALPSVLRSLRQVIDHRYEIIVVDDGSDDGTAEIAAQYNCTVLRHPKNLGKGAAVRTGLRAAGGRFVVIMDADNTYPVGAIPEMVALSERFDFIRGTRLYESATQMPLVNKIGNKLFDNILRMLHGLEGADHLTGLYGLHRNILLGMNLSANRFDLEVEIGIKAHALKLRSMAMPIIYSERIGAKKLSPLRDGWCILRRCVRMASDHHPVLRMIRGHKSEENSWG